MPPLSHPPPIVRVQLARSWGTCRRQQSSTAPVAAFIVIFGVGEGVVKPPYFSFLTMALCFIAVFNFVIVVVVVVNVVVLVIGVIFVGSNAVAVNMCIHGEGKAPDDNALVDSNNLQVGGEIPHHPAPLSQ
jgi:hypothetical protein